MDESVKDQIAALAPVVTDVDEQPKSGEWSDEHPEPTENEIQQGNELGSVIDVDNDQDNGWTKVDRLEGQP